MLKLLLNPILVVLIFLSSLGLVVIKLENPQLITDQARAIDLYGRISGDLPSIIGNSQSSGLTKDQLKTVITESIDAPTFYDFFSKLITQQTNYLTGKSDDPHFQYSLSPFKDKLKDNLANQLSSQYENLPTCKQQQLKSWSFDNGLPVCRLESGAVKQSDVDLLISQQATKFTDTLPTNLTVEGNPQARAITMKATKIINLIWLITAGFILLYLVIFRFSGLFSIGVILLFVGLIEIGFSVIGWDWIGRIITDAVNIGGDKTVASLVVTLVTAVMNVLKTFMGNLSIITLGTGAFCFVVGLVGRIHKVVPLPK